MKNLFLLGAFLLGATVTFAQPSCGTLLVGNNTATDLEVTAVAASSCMPEYYDTQIIPAYSSVIFSSTVGNHWTFINVAGDGNYANDAICMPFTCSTSGTSYTVGWECCKVVIEP